MHMLMHDELLNAAGCFDISSHSNTVLHLLAKKQPFPTLAGVGVQFLYSEELISKKELRVTHAEYETVAPNIFRNSDQHFIMLNMSGGRATTYSWFACGEGVASAELAHPEASSPVQHAFPPTRHTTNATLTPHLTRHCAWERQWCWQPRPSRPHHFHVRVDHLLLEALRSQKTSRHSQRSFHSARRTTKAKLVPRVHNPLHTRTPLTLAAMPPATLGILLLI